MPKNKLDEVDFPYTLYVQRTYATGEKEPPFDGYLTIEGMEHGDEVAVYRLVKQSKVRHQIQVVLDDFE